MKRDGLTLMEEAFCQLVAQGQTAVAAYSEAFGKPAIDDRAKRLYTKRASNLAKRPDIAARIIEAKGEQKRRDREKWETRGNEIAEKLYSRIIEADKAGELLTRETLKGVEVLAKMKGMNAPEEQVLKNGGMADGAYVPRGLEAVSDADLDALIKKGEVIDVTEVKDDHGERGED